MNIQAPPAHRIGTKAALQIRPNRAEAAVRIRREFLAVTGGQRDVIEG